MVSDNAWVRGGPLEPAWECRLWGWTQGSEKRYSEFRKGGGGV